MITHHSPTGRLFLLGFLFCLGASSLAMADDVDEDRLWEFSASATVASRYLWRGIQLSQGPVFQPEVGLSYAGFSLVAWGNVKFDSEDFKRLEGEIQQSLASKTATAVGGEG